MGAPEPKHRHRFQATQDSSHGRVPKLQMFRLGNHLRSHNGKCLQWYGDSARVDVIDLPRTGLLPRKMEDDHYNHVILKPSKDASRAVNLQPISLLLTMAKVFKHLVQFV